MGALATIRTDARRALRLLVVATMFVVGSPAGASAAPPANTPDDLPAPNGPVYATAWNGSTLYMGGAFTQVGSVVGTGAAFSRPAGARAPGASRVQGGVVNAVASDGAGGWFIGGAFTAIDGVPRSRLARILPDGSLDPAWNPGADNTVQALVRSGSTLYVAGHFTTVGGQIRNRIAALETTGVGGATGWDPNANNSVFTLALDGTTLYAGGIFGAIGGQNRLRLAALDTTVDVNMATAWNPGADNTVRAIAVVGTKVLVGGDFTNAAATPRLRFASINAGGVGTIDASVNPAPDNAVHALEPGASGDVFIGGFFANIGGLPVARLARMTVATGAIDAGYSPAPDNGVRALARDGGTLFAVGDFTTIGGQARNRAAELSITTGLATTWNPNLSAGGYAVATAVGSAYVGGTFTAVNATDRANLVAIDTTTGTVTAWNPVANGVVRTLLLDGTTMYVGGDFTSIGGQVRNRLGALNTTVDANMANAWNPNSNNSVTTMLLDGTTLYAGGLFTSIGGQLRNRLAALNTNLSVNQATMWNPNLDNGVWSLARHGANVIAAGQFLTVNGGTVRNRIAAINTTTGTATAWNPNLNGVANAVVIDGAVARVGGAFTTVGPTTRRFLAAIDLTTGLANAWHPQPNAAVIGLAVEGSTVYVAGSFTTIGNSVRRYAGAVAASGASNVTLGWDPNLVASARTVTPRGDGSVALGGDHVSAWTTNGSYGSRYSEPLAVTTTPSIAGTPQQGQTLTCTGLAVAGSGPVTTTFRWLRDGDPIGGASSPTYVPSALDAARSLRCETTSRNAVPATTVTATSTAVVVLPTAPTNATLPSITGTAQVTRTLTCSTGTWTGSPTSHAHQWLRNGTPIGGETGLSYVVQVLDIATNITCHVTAANAGGTSAPASSAAVIPVPRAPQLSVDPAIAGIAQQGQVVSCTTGTWTNAPVSYTYRWLRAGTPIGGATLNTYALALADVGVGVTCEVTATNTGGTSAPAISGAIVPISLPPSNSLAPTVLGTIGEGRLVSCLPGTWSNAPTAFTYEWLRTGTPIIGEHLAGYVVQSVDVGLAVTCRVTATNAAGAGTPATAAGSVALPAAPTLTTAPSISGTFQQNAVVSCSTGTWSGAPASFSREWHRDGVAIPGETSPILLLTVLDVGRSITCRVVATNAGGSSAGATSGGVVPVPLAPSVLVPPALVGTARESSMLGCSTGTWANVPTGFGYVWERNAVPIPGETTSSYTLDGADVGHQVRCTVTASNAGGAAPSLPSAPQLVLPLVPAIVSVPTLSGTAQERATLSCASGTWSSSPSSYTFRWVRGGLTIPGATATTYALTASDVAQAVACEVTASNAGGSSSPAISAPTIVAPLAPTISSLPLMVGTPQAGRTMACEPGAWDRSPTAYAYGWLIDGAPVPTATRSTFTLRGADVGKLATCEVTATNAGGNGVAASIAVLVTSAVAPIPVSTIAPTLSGRAAWDGFLTCTPGSWANAPSTVVISWLRDGVPMPASEGAAIALGAADVGRSVGCLVTASNDDGSAIAISRNAYVIGPPPQVRVPPRVSGRPRVGEELRCNPGRWSIRPQETMYAWTRDGIVIPDAEDSHYTLVDADLDTEIGCTQTASSFGSISSAMSGVVRIRAATLVRVSLRRRDGHRGASSARLIARRGEGIVVIGVARSDVGDVVVGGSIRLTIEHPRTRTITRWLTTDARGRFRMSFRATNDATVRAVLADRNAASLGTSHAGVAQLLVR